MAKKTRGVFLMPRLMLYFSREEAKLKPVIGTPKALAGGSGTGFAFAMTAVDRALKRPHPACRSAKMPVFSIPTVKVPELL
ncbi:MAG TPA: hypothetical protein VK815_17460 [Candidatus Acidoferrales bacterium]|nr:hypothetical protein [Candidatus Acidoferrales bacterium]